MAAAIIGGKTAQLSVAFGKRAPQYDPAWSVKVYVSQITRACPGSLSDLLNVYTPVVCC